MLELNPRIEDKIEAIQFYYVNKERINKLKSAIESHKTKIQELENQINVIQGKINKEIVGEYKESIEYGIEDGKPISRVVTKKVRPGILEKLKPYLTEKDEKTAINKYLVKLGGKETGPDKEIIDIDDFYIGNDEYDPFNVLWSR